MTQNNKTTDLPQEMMPRISEELADALHKLDGRKWESGFGWATEGDWYQNNDYKKTAYNDFSMLYELGQDIQRAFFLIRLEKGKKQIEDEMEKLGVNDE